MVAGGMLARRGAVAASVLLHGAALGALFFTLAPPSVATSTQAETPAIAIAIVSAPMPSPAPAPEPVVAAPPAPPEPVVAEPPPPPEPPVAVEEPLPLIESTVVEEIAPPPPKVERRPERKRRPERVRHRPQPEQVVTRDAETPAPAMAAAPPAPAPAPVTQQAALGAPAARSGPPPDYVSLLHHALERSKRYPYAARTQRIQGRALLRFAIDRAGNVIDYRIEKSSGYDILDREVVAMIRRASPLPPMPTEMAADKLEVVVPIPFTLR